VASSPCGSGADLHQPHWIAIIQTTAVFATKLRFPHSRFPAKTRLVVSERIGDFARTENDEPLTDEKQVYED
jgi:hypothetical protein